MNISTTISAATRTDPSLADAAAYIRAKGCDWCTPQQLLDRAACRHKIRAFIGAGPNPMAHHASSIQHGGMIGALEMFNKVKACPETAKFKAGGYLHLARENRLLGCPPELSVIPALEKAAFWRRRAADINAKLKAV